MIILVFIFLVSYLLNLYKWFYWKKQYKNTRHLYNIALIKLDEYKKKGVHKK